MHTETGCAYDIWEELQECFNNVKLGNPQNLHQRLTDTVATGPVEDDDPKPWFKEIEKTNKEVEKAGGHLKDDTKLKTLIGNPMRDSCQCHSNMKL
jgi:hypothetical protein